ncbi:MAG: nitric oxide reductase large subunit [Planctomycetes bacterium]|nr:nitric oxide reductase large subunit [Planctomycetota bacterium]
MDDLKKLWLILGGVIVATFLILGFFGREVYRQAPPIPARIVTDSGEQVGTESEILDGQQVWQGMGGQQVGSIWGHGAYQAPDWSADWLHRECVALLELWSRREHSRPYDALTVMEQGALEARLEQELRTNRYEPGSGLLTISDDRRAAMADVAAHYAGLFGGDPELSDLRESYAIKEVSVADADDRRKLGLFFFWTSWACATHRPESDVTYTNNWPHEPLIGNTPTSANLLWSVASIVLLLAGIGALVWYKAFRDRDEGLPDPPQTDPFDSIALTPSMRLTGWFCLIVIGLFCVQVLLGALTAHYTVEGQSFFGIPIADAMPYALTRTWHIQTAVFWIATAFLATGLFLAPAVGGREPRFQALGVKVLIGALLVVVLGSLAGEWLSIRGTLKGDTGFWFGHQGYEYVELGRFWQIALWVGLFLWLFLVLRGLWPALKRKSETRSIIFMFAGASAAIGLFYGAGLLYGARTHLSVMEYWRWWVVHLWVEGFMEVFATAAIAFVFVQFGLIRAKSAGRAVIFSTSIFLVGGIPGTFHHLYFSGTPVSIMAIGSTFSALEVVPLVLIGFEAWETLRMQGRSSWMTRYRWPIRFFVGVTFWNLVGAGLFGFLINPPIALYYMQGLNTTPVHGHTALFGVYGLLSLGLILVILRRLRPEGNWREAPLKFSFWSLNIGLGLMVLLSLLPVGIIQAQASMEHGLWYARSADLLQQPLIETLRWLRIVGDTIFLAGVGSLAWFAIGIWTGRSIEPSSSCVDISSEVSAEKIEEPALPVT